MSDLRLIYPIQSCTYNVPGCDTDSVIVETIDLEIFIERDKWRHIRRKRLRSGKNLPSGIVKETYTDLIKRNNVID